jgi:ABC-type lipoprotein release transport system permease subunit
MLQLFLIAARNLAQHTRRTLLLGGAISAVTALLVVLLGLSNGIRATMLESATTLMAGHVNVGGFFKPTAGTAAPVVTHYQQVLEIVRKNVPELDYVVTRGRGYAKLVSDTGSIQSGISGIDVEQEMGLHQVLQIEQGSLDGLKNPNTILIFHDQAEKLGVKVGDALTISSTTPRGTSNTVDVRVAAIAKDVGLLSKFSTLLPSATLRSLYQLTPESTGVVMLYLKDLNDISKVQERLRVVLAKAGYQIMDADPAAFWFKFPQVTREAWTGQKLDITNWEDETSFLKWTITTVQVLSGALIFILLVIISVGIMNTLWIAIRERTREVGTLRAIGMQRTRVMAMFLIEALVLALGATAVGAAVGFLACVGVNAAHVEVPVAVQLFLMSSKLHLLVNLVSVVGAILVITFCAMVVSLVPSFLAARLKPVTAMHHIG